jgi:phospholipid-binding lipoprotein MlaA
MATPALAQAPAPESAVWDPLETVNRAAHTFNMALATTVTTPVAAAYRSVVPAVVQAGIDNAFTNLREPVTAAASLLQGDFGNAGVSAGRFAINSTAGIGGIFDVAGRMGWVSRAEDIGATLCSYGIPDGPYLVLPVLGPTTVRDLTGQFALYAATFGVLGDDLALPYLVADRAVAYASDGVTPTVPPGDPYLAQQEAHLALRRDLCRDDVAGGDVKASPLGGVIRRPAPGIVEVRQPAG